MSKSTAARVEAKQRYMDQSMTEMHRRWEELSWPERWLMDHPRATAIAAFFAGGAAVLVWRMVYP